MANHHWSSWEIKKIQQNFKIAPDFHIARLLQTRSECAVAFKRRRLGLKYEQEWLNEQIKKNRLSPYF